MDEAEVAQQARAELAKRKKQQQVPSPSPPGQGAQAHPPHRQERTHPLSYLPSPCLVLVLLLTQIYSPYAT